MATTIQCFVVLCVCKRKKGGRNRQREERGNFLSSGGAWELKQGQWAGPGKIEVKVRVWKWGRPKLAGRELAPAGGRETLIRLCKLSAALEKTSILGIRLQTRGGRQRSWVLSSFEIGIDGLKIFGWRSYRFRIFSPFVFYLMHRAFNFWSNTRFLS